MNIFILFYEYMYSHSVKLRSVYLKLVDFLTYDSI
jgi:hypothetical protein